MVVYNSKKQAEKARKRKRSPEAFAVIYQGPATGRKVGWVVKSRVRGKRPKRKKR